MNKLAIVAAALLLIVLLALPRVVGGITEARVVERVAAIDANPQAAAEIRSFERGWFRSTAHIELTFGPGAVASNAAGEMPLGVFITLPIVVEFAQGPIAVLDGLHFGWSKLVARPDDAASGIGELTQTLGVPYLFEFRGRSGYLGGLDFDADAPPFELPIGEALLTFSGATLAGSFAARELTADAQIGAVQFASPTGTLAVRGAHFMADNELRSQYVLPGAASLSIESVSMAGARGGAPLFEAAKLTIASDTAIDPAGELLRMQLSYGADSVRLEDNELTAGVAAVAVRNVDVAAVEAYGAAAADAAAAGADPASILASLGPHLERALRRSPSVTLDPLRFRLNGEPFDGRVELTTNTARLPAAGTFSLEDPLLLAGLVNAKADLRLSKALAAELATLAARMQLGADASIPPDQLDYMAEAQSGLMLTMLVGQGVLVEEGELYVSSLDYTDGTVTLNGTALPFGLP
jgi:hypothetical protein